LDWLDLGDPTQRLRPSHFEIYYCKESLRDEHYLEALLEASQSQSLVRKQLFSFWDLFYPLAIDRTQRIFLHVGQFYREPPDWKTLSAQWRELTGQEAVGTNPDFIHFARMALGLCVLDQTLLDAVERFIELYAEFVVSRGQGSDVQERI